jgi:hypothetical protein
MSKVWRIKFRGRAKNAPELFVDVPADSQKMAVNILRQSIGNCTFQVAQEDTVLRAKRVPDAAQ